MSLSMWVKFQERIDALEKRVAELETRAFVIDIEPEKRKPGRPPKQTTEQVN